MTTDLIRPGEEPEAARRRLERRRDFERLVETEAGQALLRECAKRAAAARRESAR